MFISGIGGIRVFSVEKEEDTMAVIFQYLNAFGKEILREKLIIEKKEDVFVFVRNKKISGLIKKQMNDLLTNMHSYSKDSISKIDKINSGADYTEVYFKTNKKEHNVLIDWSKTKDLMPVPAANMGGEYFITPHLNDGLFDNYWNYFFNATDSTAEVVSKMNLIMYFESFEQQRTTHLMNVISGIFILRGMAGKSSFEKVNYSDLINKDIKLNFNGSINEYSLKINLDLIIEYKEVVYHIFENGVFNENDLLVFLKKVNVNNMKMYKYVGKNTNSKDLVNTFVIENGEEMFIEKDFDITGFIPEGKNIKINIESLEFEEVFTLEEIFTLYVGKIRNIINFLNNKKD